MQVASMKPAGSLDPDRPNEILNAGDDWQGMFLDCMAHLVEHWKLIIFVTLLAGVAAFALTYSSPKIYASVAYLSPLDEQTAKATEALMHSAPILDSVVAKFPQYQPGYNLDQKRNYLSSRLHWQIVKGSDARLAIYTLRLDDTDPHRAQSMLNAVLESWLESKRPRPDNTTRLEKSLEASEVQAADLSLVIAELKKRPDAMFADGRNGYFPPNIVDLIKMRTETAARIVELNMALRAGSRDAIFSPPSLPEQPNGSNRSIAIAGAMAVTLGALIAFFLLRWSLRLVTEKPAYAPAFARMRRAMPW
jgi:subunit length determinant Wzz-like protein